MKVREEIKKLKAQGMKNLHIAKILNLHVTTVWYHLNDEKRKEKNVKAVERFRSKPLEEKREEYKKRGTYIKDWMRSRYTNDSEYREKIKARNREYNKNKSRHSDL